jgi:hypothetical protein
MMPLTISSAGDQKDVSWFMAFPIFQLISLLGSVGVGKQGL